jgi:GNAT superfamily N-acetyltransferase
MVEPKMRPASIDDAALASDLITAAYPAEPEDPEVTRFRWAHPKDGWTQRRFIASMNGQPIACVWLVHGPWDEVPERHCDIGADVDLAHQTDELLRFFWTWIADQAVADGARILHSGAAEDEPLLLDALDHLGYERERSEKVWSLDLAKHGERLLADSKAARDKMNVEGIELMTLTDWPGPQTLKKLHELNEATRQDIPSSQPIIAQSFANFMDRMSAPDLRQDRVWVARHGDRLVAMSFLRFPPVRGNVWTGYTCSDPEYRGRGIARAVKLQSLAQAIELGIPLVRTGNDFENAPMLHINEMLGYEVRPGFVNLVKRVSSR